MSMMRENQDIVPAQKKGAKSDTHYSVRTSNAKVAMQLFQNARLNLLNVNGWHSLTGSGAVFQLVNEQGELLNGLAEKGNYIRIHIKALPGTKEGEGFEWVKVEMIEEGKLKYHEYTAIRVRPTVPPFADKAETAHFFSNEATSSFCVIRNENRVTASVLGRNEEPNTEPHNVLSLVRNVAVAIGAMLGMNKPQWKGLTKGIIRKKGAVMRV
jgi:hypothetical protein